MIKEFARRGIWVGIAVFFLTGGVSAQDNHPCYDPQTQMEINACAAERYKKADAELNEVYKQVIAKLGNERETQLKSVQRAWIEFRDANCQFKSAEYQGDSMYPTLYHECLTAMTEFRTMQLREELTDLSEQ